MNNNVKEVLGPVGSGILNECYRIEHNLSDIGTYFRLKKDLNFIHKYFSEHDLTSDTLEVCCRFVSILDAFNIELPDVETLDTNFSATDDFIAQLNKAKEKLDISISDSVRLLSIRLEYMINNVPDKNVEFYNKNRLKAFITDFDYSSTFLKNEVKDVDCANLMKTFVKKYKEYLS